MKKIIYMALGALTMLTNLANAAGFLSGVPHIEDFTAFHAQVMPICQLEKLAKVQEGMIHGEDPSVLRNQLPAIVNDRDVLIMQRLVHLVEPAAAGAADLYGQILGQAAALLADIPGINPAETDLWAYFYSIVILQKCWSKAQMPDDHSHVVPDHLVNNHFVSGWPEEIVINGVRMDFDVTMLDLTAKNNAWRASVGLPPLAAHAGVAGAHA